MEEKIQWLQRRILELKSTAGFKNYPQDLKIEISELIKHNKNQKQLCLRIGLGYSTFRGWSKNIIQPNKNSFQVIDVKPESKSAPVVILTSGIRIENLSETFILQAILHAISK